MSGCVTGSCIYRGYVSMGLGGCGRIWGRLGQRVWVSWGIWVNADTVAGRLRGRMRVCDDFSELRGS